MRGLKFTVAAIGACLLFAGPTAEALAADLRQATIRGQTMGTYYRVTIAGRVADRRLAPLEAGILAILRAVDRHMSTWRPDSTLSRFNDAPGGSWIPVPHSLVDVMSVARSVSRASEGAFDVTAGPLVKLWGFGPGGRPESPPSRSRIAEYEKLISYQKVDIRRHPPALKKALDDMYIDLSGIAKGYAVDEVSRFLEARGIRDYLVDIGGELRADGFNSDGEQWIVGIEEPRGDGQRSIQRLIGLHDEAVATAGDYRNFFQHEGRRYSHIIDPRTGRPVNHRLASVTVVAKTAALADACATAVLVLGPDDGLALLERLGLNALLILNTNSGFREQSTAGFSTLPVAVGDAGDAARWKPRSPAAAVRHH